MLAIISIALVLDAGVAAAQAPSPATPATPGAPTAPAPAGHVESLDPCGGLPLWQRPGCKVSQGVQAGVDSMVGGVFDQLYGWVAGGAAWLLSRLVSLLDSSTRPDVSAGWFARQHRLMGALAAALVLPLLLISTLTAVVRQDWRGLLRSYLVYLPAAMLGTAIAIPMVDVALAVTDWMGSVLMDAMRGDVTAFTDSVSSALTTTAGVTPAGGVAPFLLFIGAAIIALGAFAVWVELVLRTAGIYVALFFLPLGFASLVWPSTRAWFTRLVKALAALILSKFIIVAVIALAAAALGSISGPEGSGFTGVIAGSALMLMAAFSPLVLFRLADIAGDDMASAVGGVTQHRTSPVPTPSAPQSAAAVYGRIMHARSNQPTGASASAGRAATGGMAAATGGAALVAAAVAGAAKAPGGAAQAAGQSIGQAANPRGHNAPAGPTGPATRSQPSRPRPAGRRPVKPDPNLARAQAIAAGPPDRGGSGHGPYGGRRIFDEPLPGRSPRQEGNHDAV